MAGVAEQESETRLCSNCKKEIPAANFTIHEIHCSRNIGTCHFCKELIPKSEMKTHLELEHTQVACKCGMKMESGHLQDHVASECSLRPVTCQHCDIELAFHKLQDHEDYCGARTERCSRCFRNVMLKDMKEHPDDCWEKAKEARVGQTRPCLNSEADVHNIHTIKNVLHPDASVGSLPRVTRLPESRLYNCLSGDQHTRNLNRRGAAPLQAEQNQDRLKKANNHPPFGSGEPDCNLDYLVALSLQRENHSQDYSVAEIHRELQKNICPAKAGSGEKFLDAPNSSMFSWDFRVPANTSNKPKIETLLPCEFCEELYPEDNLIRHQTSCNPASALASFSKRSSSIPRPDRSERLIDLWEQLQSTEYIGSRETLPPQYNSGSGCIMIPCEFCGILLEEEILFHHQDQCDLRPATATSTGRSPLQQEEDPAVGKLERAESPALLRRHTRHQGDLSPQYPEELRQWRPPAQPVQGSHSQGYPASARRSQLTSPSCTRENHVGSSERRTTKDLGGGGGSTSSLPPASMAVRHHPLDFPASGYVPSFPVTVPTRPRLRSDSSRSPTPAGPASYNSTKTKPWQAESGYPDKEE